jgi:hypothetical protein
MPSQHLGMFPRTPFVRRYLIQIVAVTVAVVGVVVLGVIAFRPSGGSGGSGAVKSPVTARGTATPDPRVDEVKAVVRKFLEAYWDSARSGDTRAVDQLTEAGSEAYGNAAVAATLSKSEHHNFIVSRLDIDETAWQVDVTLTQASVNVTYRAYGHEADWPSLQPRESDRETQRVVDKFQLEIVGSSWLVRKYN